MIPFPPEPNRVKNLLLATRRKQAGLGIVKVCPIRIETV
jgi:hypothetical protein